MSLNPAIVIGIFDAWGIDFIGRFIISFENEYILLLIYYASKWVEAISTRTNEATIMVKFLKENIFCTYGTTPVINSDQGTHFNN